MYKTMDETGSAATKLIYGDLDSSDGFIRVMLKVSLQERFTGSQQGDAIIY